MLILSNTQYFGGGDTIYTKQWVVFQGVDIIYTKQYAVFSGVDSKGYQSILSTKIYQHTVSIPVLGVLGRLLLMYTFNLLKT